MPANISTKYLILGSAVIILTSATLRFLPFLLFRNRDIPRWVERIGKWLPPAMMALLVVYCYRDIDYTNLNEVLPAIIAGLSVVGLHLWKRQALLSIFGGTLIYMVLIQLIFI